MKKQSNSYRKGSNDKSDKITEHKDAYNNNRKDEGDIADDTSVFSFWTMGPGPDDNNLVTPSSLDSIFGRSYDATPLASNSTDSTAKNKYATHNTTNTFPSKKYTY